MQINLVSNMKMKMDMDMNMNVTTLKQSAQVESIMLWARRDGKMYDMTATTRGNAH